MSNIFILEHGNARHVFVLRNIASVAFVDKNEEEGLLETMLINTVDGKHFDFGGEVAAENFPKLLTLLAKDGAPTVAPPTSATT